MADNAENSQSSETFIPFEELPEARNWRVGQIYKMKLVGKQISINEKGATFKIIDAQSLERDKRQRFFISSDSGVYGG